MPLLLGTSPNQVPTNADLGTMAFQDQAAVKITGGDINGSLGGTTPAPVSATTLNTTGNVTLGDASTDTVQVNGYMGVGGDATSNVGLYLTSSALASSGQYGVFLSPTSTAAATATTTSLYVKASTAAAAYTSSAVRSIHIADTTKGAGSTITDQQGLYISDQTQGTNNYGITSLVSSGATKWNIYASGTAQNYFAGSVGIGTNAPSASAILDVQSTTKGVRMPNMTTTQKNAITSPAAGLMVFDTTLAKLCVYSGAAWQTVTSI